MLSPSGEGVVEPVVKLEEKLLHNQSTAEELEAGSEDWPQQETMIEEENEKVAESKTKSAGIFMVEPTPHQLEEVAAAISVPCTMPFLSSDGLGISITNEDQPSAVMAVANHHSDTAIATVPLMPIEKNHPVNSDSSDKDCCKVYDRELLLQLKKKSEPPHGHQLSCNS